MTCSEFLASYSDFQDGEIQPSLRRAFESHLEECAACGRYHGVVTRGVEFLRASPIPELPDDFEDRLRHSIYTIEEGRRQSRLATGPGGTSAMAAVALGAVMLAVLMTPFLFNSTPTVDLPPIMVHSPPPGATGQAWLRAFENTPHTFPALGRDPWGPAPILLYPHSPLGKRYREAGVVRTGVQ